MQRCAPVQLRRTRCDQSWPELGSISEGSNCPGGTQRVLVNDRKRERTPSGVESKIVRRSQARPGTDRRRISLQADVAGIDRGCGDKPRVCVKTVGTKAYTIVSSAVLVIEIVIFGGRSRRTDCNPPGSHVRH